MANQRSTTASLTNGNTSKKSMRVDVLVQQSALLTQLTQRASQSNQLLQTVRASLPPPLQKLIQAGPLEGAKWCLIVPNSAAAAKLRHFLPRILEQLTAAQNTNLPKIQEIRIRVSTGTELP